MEQENVAAVVQNENSENERKTEITSPKQAIKRKACSEVDVNVQEDAQATQEPLVKRTKLRSDKSIQPGTAFTGLVEWTVDVIADGKGLFANDEEVYIGTRDGRVVMLNHSGELIRQYKLKGEVSMITEWSGRVLSWVHAKNGLSQWKGALYDITEESPQMLMDILQFGTHVIHATMVDGCLALGDSDGNIVLLGCDAKILWERKQDLGSGGMFESDQSGIYFAHKKKVCKYNIRDGSTAWTFELGDGRQQLVQSGCIYDDSVYIEVDGRVVELDKDVGSVIKEFQPDRHMAENIVVEKDTLYTGCCPTIVFDRQDGMEKYRMNFSCRLRDAALKVRNDGKLLVYWDKLYCVDTTPEGIQRAIGGKSRKTETYSYDFDENVREESTTVSCEPASDDDELVLVKCTEKKGQLVVHPCGSAFNNDYGVLLPPLLRQEGVTYRVGSLIQSKMGNFYMVTGDITKINGINEEQQPENTNGDYNDLKKPMDSNPVEQANVCEDPCSVQIPNDADNDNNQ